MPLLVSMFFLRPGLWNLFGVVPSSSSSRSMSRIGYPRCSRSGCGCIEIYFGIKHQGPVGYFKNMMFPPGLPKSIYFLVAPIELLST